MNTNEKKLEKWKSKLIKADLLQDGEQIIDVIDGDYWRRRIKSSGHIVFTDRKFLFCGRFMTNLLPINYHDVVSLKRCFIGPFLPTGVRVTTFDHETGSNQQHILSIFHRNHWIEFIESKR